MCGPGWVELNTRVSLIWFGETKPLSFFRVSVNMHSFGKKNQPLVMSQKADSQDDFCGFKRLLKMLFSVDSWKIGLQLLLNRSPRGIVLKISAGLFLFFSNWRCVSE